MRRALFAVSMALAGCAPELDVRESSVDRPRVLAVVAEPAEARPGAAVTYRVTAAAPLGALEPAPVTLSHCAAPKPPSENASVATACDADAQSPLLQRENGDFLGRVPLDACRLFGPDPPPGGARPRDPDATGGFYQPLRITGVGEVAYHLQRVVCNPGDVAAEVARSFTAGYQPNKNPNSIMLAVFQAGTLMVSDSSAAVTEVDGLSELELRVSWEPEDREAYLYLDRERQELVTRVEALRVAWFATSGALDRDELSVAEADLATRSASAVYRVPNGPGIVGIWAVVHDSRLGSAVRHVRLSVR